MENNKKTALYIHVPFCVKKCAYCDFASYEDYSLQEVYFDALKKEIEIMANVWEGEHFDTLFIGGGTPSSVKNEYIEKTMEAVNKYFKPKFIEATIEANPGTVDWQKLQFYRYLGIDRVSFGVQAAQDHLLANVGRIHDFDTAKESIALACRAGFTNINVDIMSGLPEQNKDDLIESVELANKLCATHISMYTLKLEEGTLLEKQIESGEVTLPDKDEEYEMSLAARKKLEEFGYNRYEISNYALDGYECKHNLHYWYNDNYLGLGIAAASSRGKTRSTNTREIGEYIHKIKSGKPAYVESDISSDEEYAFETFMLGLRLSEGVDIKEYEARHDIEIYDRFGDLIKSLQERGLADVYENKLYLTDAGMDLQNSVLVEFMERFDF